MMKRFRTRDQTVYVRGAELLTRANDLYGRTTKKEFSGSVSENRKRGEREARRINRRETGTNLFDGGEAVLLRDDLSPFADRKHARLGADGPEFGAGRVRTQARDEVPSDVALGRH